MSEKNLSDMDLDSLFAEAKATTPALSDGLQARILADAQDIQSAARAPVAVQRSIEPAGSRLLRAIGGWGGLGGLTMATVAGLWIGFSNPTLVSPGLSGTELSEVTEDDLFGDILLGDSLFFDEG